MTAQDILDSPIWREVVDSVDNALIEEFRLASPADTDDVRDIAYRLGALSDIASELEDALRGHPSNLTAQKR
jgi:hypothetical protein